jgi:Gpi18-like mannosyltransferase
MNNKDALVTLSIALISVTGIFFFPLLIIWSINNLSNLDVQYTWKTWISVYVLIVVFAAIMKEQKKQETISTPDLWWRK